MAPKNEDDFEAPPIPPGLSADTVYLGAMQAWSTRVIVREVRRERPIPKGPFAWFTKLSPVVQTSFAGAITYILIMLAGAVFERVTGHAPPQPTQPVISASPANIVSQDEG